MGQGGCSPRWDSHRGITRRVVGYVLVDGDLPKAGVQDWPMPPVTYIRWRARRWNSGWDLLDGGISPPTFGLVADQSA